MSVLVKILFIFNFVVIVVLSTSSDVNVRKFRNNNSRIWNKEPSVFRLFNYGRLVKISRVFQKPSSGHLLLSWPGPTPFPKKVPKTHLVFTRKQLKRHIPEISSATEIDVPLKEDLPVYIEALQRVIKSTKTRHSDMDLNMKFGLFLTQVNLEWAIYHGVKMEKKLKDSLNSLVRENEMKLIIFHNTILEYSGERQAKNKILSSLLKNCSAWVYRIRSFNSTGWRPQYYIRSFQSKHYDWDRYESDIDNVKKWIPTPESSDNCIHSLTRVSMRPNTDRCQNTLQECNNMILYGSDFGYAITHRLLYLLIARYTIGCDASPHKNYSPATLCMKIYAESQFIANNEYKNIDLILEQSALCSLEGYAAFLKRSFLTKVLEHQTPFGCFGMNLYKEEESYIQERKGGICNGHVTSVAAGTISSALRFIVQTYYT